MSSHFFLSITLFDAVFHGRRDDGVPEWPPSPLRAFQSLVAAAAAYWRQPEFTEYAIPALGWLETLDPPEVLAPAGHTAAVPYRLYVPNNAGDLVTKAWSSGNLDASMATHRTEKDVQPTRLVSGDAFKGGNILWFVWRLPTNAQEPVGEYVNRLSIAARSITHLGWGIDMAAGHGGPVTEAEIGSIVREHRLERWVPGRGGTPLRVPQAETAQEFSTLQALTHRHGEFTRRMMGDGPKDVPPLSANAYRLVGYRREHGPASRPFAAFKLLHPETGEMRSYSATNCVRVAGMVRGAAGQVASASGRASEWVDRFVYGHHQGSETFPRFSYLPLPSIQPHVGVGGIRRVLIAELPGAEGNETRWINRLLSGYVATNEQGRDALLVPLAGDNVLARYIGPSQEWATVTPIALPGCDDGKSAKRDRLFAKALKHAGYSLSALAQVDFRRFPFFNGAQDALAYRPTGDHHLSHCSVYHVRLRWRTAFRGPLAVGSGRHCGLGVFAAYQ